MNFENPLLKQRNFFKPSKPLRILAIMETFYADCSLSQKELGKKTAMSGAMANQYVSELNKQGLIHPEAINGKCYEYKLTPDGEKKRQMLMGEYCAEIVQIYSSLKKLILQKLSDLAQKEQTSLVLFGASETCEVVLSALQKSNKFNIVAIVDNDKNKHSNPFHHHVILPPATLENINFDAVVITSFGRQKEIFNQLLPLSQKKNFPIIRL
jgi:DNA-binding MarR family transcriptional regulator